jgi:hypothetical protein
VRPPRLRSALVAAALALAGCRGGDGQAAPPSPTPAVGPHGGPAAPLPGDAGYGEVVVESLPASKAGLDARVFVYFLKPDLKTPLAPPPSDVRVKLELPGDQSADLALSPEPQSGDRAGAARFASKPGPYATDQPRGALTATVAGQAVTVPFSAR